MMGRPGSTTDHIEMYSGAPPATRSPGRPPDRRLGAIRREPRQCGQLGYGQPRDGADAAEVHPGGHVNGCATRHPGRHCSSSSRRRNPIDQLACRLLDQLDSGCSCRPHRIRVPVVQLQHGYEIAIGVADRMQSALRGVQNCRSPKPCFEPWSPDSAFHAEILTESGVLARSCGPTAGSWMRGTGSGSIRSP